LQVELDEKVAIVTGASSGIGAEIVRSFAAAGAAVVAVGRDRERLAAVVADAAATSGSASALEVDLAAASPGEEIVEATVKQHGGIDVIVNVGGHFVNTPLAETPVEQLEGLWQVHVRAPFLLTQAALPHLRNDSVLIFFSSTVVHSGFAPYAAYTSAKGGVEALARSLAAELAPKTRVNTIVPGFTRTPMVEDQFGGAPGLEQAIIARTPVGELKGPRSAARLATFLCSEEAEYIHGATFVVDGGWTATGWQSD
jgi:NAD(P)-dependent dehydrogenase (short-subunit alcohol dehydrogenase family)